MSQSLKLDWYIACDAIIYLNLTDTQWIWNADVGQIKLWHVGKIITQWVLIGMGKLTKSGDDLRHPAALAPPLATSHTVKGLMKYENSGNAIMYRCFHVPIQH